VNKRALVGFFILFIIEVLIAVFIDDAIIRPLVGDVLVVILLFFAVRSLSDAPTLPIALGVLIFAWGVEFAQYFRLIYWLGWEDNAIARTVIGTRFDPRDLVAYTLGAVMIAIAEQRWGHRYWR
jgi:hypothetical protein